MRRTAAIRRLAAVHGVTWRWLAVVLVSWVAIGPLSHVGLPPIDPHVEVEERPLECLAVLTLAGPALLHAVPLRSRTGWLTAVSPQPQRVVRAGWAFAHLLIGLMVGAALCLVVLPLGVSVYHGLCVWAGAWGLATILLAFGWTVAAALVPTAVLAANSFAAFVPWRYDVVYNPDLVRPLTLIAGGLCALAVLAAAAAPRRLW